MESDFSARKCSPNVPAPPRPLVALGVKLSGEILNGLGHGMLKTITCQS